MPVATTTPPFHLRRVNTRGEENQQSSMSNIQDPSGNCQYCNCLEPGHIASKFSIDDWVAGILSSTCQTCQIVVQVIQDLFPEFLGGGTIHGKVTGLREDPSVWYSVDEGCRVIIGKEQNGQCWREVDFQLYYPLNDDGQQSKEPEFPQIGTAGDISLVPGDAKMWSFLRNCLDHCTKEHNECKVTQDPYWYPERLLYLAQDSSHQQTLQLVQTQHHHPGSPYITLSHCWGSSSPFCTTKHNISGLLDIILLVDLPRTFQDCIVVAQELGISYIWIDSLCIIQDDRDDWARHAQCMDKIYENSLFTVAAVSSPDSTVPFLGSEAPGNRDDWQAIAIDRGTGIVESSAADRIFHSLQPKARRYDPFLSPGFFSGPLEYRGWAWQERYLSTRIINFTDEEARWHCKTSKTCECVGVMPTQRFTPPSDSKDAGQEEVHQTPRRWRDIVTDYSGRQLTFNTDRLPALSGVASPFYNSLQSEYLAGLWLADLPRALAWYRRDLSDSPAGKLKMWRSLNNKVPSWSWASISGETRWMWNYRFKAEQFQVEEIEAPLEMQVDLKSFSCRPSSDNIFGEVETGSYIRLQGRVVEAEMCSDIHGCASVIRRGFRPQHVVPDCHLISTTSTSNLPGSFVQKIQSHLHTRKKRNKPMKRAVPTERLSHVVSNGEKCRGQLHCLLLFTITKGEENHACILILGKQEGNGEKYERLGIGSSDSGWSRPLYKSRKKWETWEGWEEWEQWEQWEAWFADAETRMMTIL